MSTLSQMDIFTEALPQTKQYVLYNPGDEQMSPMYAGRHLPVPMYKKHVTDKENPDLPSARDADGDWIPGTLVIGDIWRQDMNLGSQELVWSVDNCVKFLFNLNLNAKQPSGLWFEQGLSLLPKNASKDLVRAVFVEGRKRYENWCLLRDRETIAAIDAANAKRRSLNIPEMPPSDDYVNASIRIKTVLEARAQVEKDRFTAANVPVLEDEKNKIRQLAKEVAEATGEDLEKVTETLLNDPDTLKTVRKKGR